MQRLMSHLVRTGEHSSLIAIELLLACFCGCALFMLGADGGSWILGGILAGAIGVMLHQSRYQGQIQPNRTARKIGQILVGLTVGLSMQQSQLPAITAQLPIFLLLTLCLLGGSSLIGYLYSRLERTDLLTALLATVPGNIGVMASIAADCGKDAALVSLVQLLRFTAVIFLVPIVAGVSTTPDLWGSFRQLWPDSTVLNLPHVGLLLATLVITKLVVQLGTWLKFPVAAFSGAILVGGLVDASLNTGWLWFLSDLHDFNLPPVMNWLGQILLGITIGEYWGINPNLRKSTIAYATIPVILTFIASFLAAGLAKILTGWDWLTCLLVTSPGGSPEMILIALTLHQDVEVVTIGHLVRLLLINLLLPAIVSGVNLLEQQRRLSLQNSP